MSTGLQVKNLPEKIRQELDQKLIAGDFFDYKVLSDWLESIGYNVTRANVSRYGKKFIAGVKSVKELTEHARIIIEAAKDDVGILGEATITLYLHKSFKILAKMGDFNFNNKDFEKISKFGNTLANLLKSMTFQKKWMSDKTKKTADEVTREIKSAGLSEDKAEEIRNKILGIV